MVEVGSEKFKNYSRAVRYAKRNGFDKTLEVLKNYRGLGEAAFVRTLDGKEVVLKVSE